MFRKISLALLAGASCLGVGIDRASAIDAAEFSQPSVIYASPPAQAPMRTASAQRSNMGGGFIEFLFGDGPQSQRYQQAPVYQQQPSYDQPRALLPQILSTVKQRTIPEVLVVGHTDTMGTPRANIDLGLVRANTVRTMLVQVGLDASTIEVRSHGESDLLVKTPDETPEPRNRRVEISVR